ncbi:hypothetical protein JGU66_22320 [Myxococcaceae bacterium JPH2]|nr:hypothetical protein [Myxococcaceae bacterium JPH2]
MTRRLVVLGGLVLALGLVGCANDRKMLKERTSSFVVYHQEPTQVMHAAEKVLSEQGYSLLPSTDPYLLHTPWKMSGSHDMGVRWSKAIIQGYPLPRGGMVVRAYNITAFSFARQQSLPTFPSSGLNTSTDVANLGPRELIAVEPGIPRSAHPTLNRSLETEWEILEELEPRFTAAVDREVDRYVAAREH